VVLNGWLRFFTTVGSVRLRLPAVRVREDTTSPADEPEADGPVGSGTVTGAADAAGQGQRSVRDEIEQQPGPPLALPAPVTSGLLALQRSYRRAAEEGDRLAERWWWLPGRAFAIITLAPALLAIALLVPGTGMLLAGRLLPVPVLIIFVPLAVALCYFGMRELPVQWPLFGRPDAAVDDTSDSGDGSDADGRRVGVPVGALLATVAIAAGFGVWQAALRSEQVFGVGDPSVYLQYGYWIAKHGTARIPTLASSFGTSGGLVFASSGFSVSGGVITPGFLPGLPIVLAAGTWISGLGGELLMPAVLGGCAVLSFGGVVGRLAGGRWAPVGALVLAASLPEIYVSRTPFSEPLVQVLLFGGLCLFIDSFGVIGGGLALAGLGGLALGLTVLTWIGSLSILLPAFPVLAWLFVARRRQAAPFGIGLVLGIAIGLSVALTLGRSYLSTLSTQLHTFGLAAAAFGLATALIAPLAIPEVRGRVWRAFTRRLRVTGLAGEEISLPSLAMLVQWAAVALPVVALIVLAARPYVETVLGQTSPTLIREVASLQRLAGLPVDGRRQYYEQSLNWVVWYIGLPAVLLACAGAAGIGRRLVRAVLDWRSSLVAARLWGLPFVIIAWSVGTVLWDPAVAPWQLWASHRLVPVVLPGLVLLAVWVSSRLTLRAALLGASRVTVALVAICCVLALAIPPLVTSLNPGIVPHASVGRYSSGLAKFVSRVRLRGVGASSTYAGSVAAASSLCASIGPSASVVFVNASTAAEFASTVRVLCGLPAASMAAGSSSASVEQVATSIERTGRRPVLLGSSRASVSLFGVVPHVVVSLRTSGDAMVLTGPPAGNWPVSYTVWMASPLA
jgi:hypothetical protein